MIQNVFFMDIYGNNSERVGYHTRELIVSMVFNVKETVKLISHINITPILGELMS